MLEFNKKRRYEIGECEKEIESIPSSNGNGNAEK